MASKPTRSGIPQPPDDSTYRRLIANRMALLAIHGEEQIEARSLFGFQRAGALEGVGRSSKPLNKLARIVADSSHRLREPAPLGPCILIRPEHPSEGYQIFPVSALLIDDKPGNRAIALSYIDGLSAAGMITQRTQETLRQYRSPLSSRETSLWRVAASAIYDAVEEDWLLNLAGLRQAIRWQGEEATREYLQKVLKPTTAAVDSIDLVWWQPHSQGSAIQDAISQMAHEFRNLQEALDRYFDVFGYLPFAPDASMGRLISEWCAANRTETAHFWEDLWKWADTKNSPLARYHACQVLVSNPTLIPPGSLTDLWSEICCILSAENDNEQRWFNAWQLRLSLARHFCHHFECLIPWNDGERPHALAWWLTEKVASIFDSTGVNLDLLEEYFFARSYMHWHLARNRAGASELRVQSLFPPSLWQRALLAQIGGSGDLDLTLPATTPHLGGIVETSFMIHGWFGFRSEPSQRQEKEGRRISYAFEMPLDTPMDAWTSVRSDDDDPEQFISSLRSLTDATLADQLSNPDPIPDDFSLTRLRNATYSQVTEAGELAQMMRDDLTAKRILTTISDASLWPLIDALMESAASVQTDWRVSVPHIFASACLACENEERRNLLFVLTVHCSIATNTVSAIRLIFRDLKGHTFRELMRAWHVRLQEEMGLCPPWVAARIRSVVASLDV